MKQIFLQVSVVLAFFACFSNTTKAQTDLVFTEIMYNDPSIGTDELDFIEIYNKGLNTISLAGYHISGVDFTFPAGASLNAGEYTLVAYSATQIANEFGITAYEWPVGANLSNSGEGLALYNPFGTLMDTLFYDDDFATGWPILADGGGASLILCDYNSDNSLATNWAAATTNQGIYGDLPLFASPKAANSCVDTTPPSLYSVEALDLTTLILTFDENVNSTQANNINNYTGNFGSIVSLSSSNNVVTLTLGSPISYGVIYTLEAFNVTDLFGNMNSTQQTASFVLNEPVSLVITEIMYNDPGIGTDLLEFIEIFNSGPSSVDVSSYYFAGIDFTFPAGTAIAAGDYKVVALSASEMFMTFGINTYQWTGNSLSNSGEIITLYNPAGEIIDQVPYDDGGSWPTAADGNGPSLILCDYNADNSLASSWTASNNYIGNYIGVALYASPGFANNCGGCLTYNITENAAICEGETYTLPNGIITATAGSYPLTLTSSEDCDSTITTILTVHPNYNETAMATICEGDSYVLPNGATATVAGDYTFNLLSQAGCDSTVVISLSVVNSFAVSIDVAICEGETYTLANGTMVDVAGAYPITLTSSIGCDSVVTTNLSVNPNYDVSANVEICDGEIYTLPNGTMVDVAGAYPITLTSSIGCDSTITVNLSIVSSFNTSENVTICNGETYTLPNGSTATTAGTYFSSLSSVSGCDSLITTTISITTLPTLTINAEICEDEIYTLPNGTTTSSSGTYPFVFNSVAGCDSNVIVSLTVNDRYSDVSTVSICDNETYILPDGLSTNTAGTYVNTFSTVEGCDSTITTILNITNSYEFNFNINICDSDLPYLLPNGSFASAAGTYPITYTATNGCDSTILNVLNVTDNYQVTENVDACFGENYFLPNGTQVFNNGTYTSNLSSQTGCDSIIYSVVTFNPSYTIGESLYICGGDDYILPNGTVVSEDGVYPVTLTTINGCDSTIIVDLDVLPIIEANISQTNPLCGENSGMLSTAPSGGTAPYTVQWKRLGTNNISTANTINNIPQGTYQLTITDVIGCTFTEIITLDCLTGCYSPINLTETIEPNGCNTLRLQWDAVPDAVGYQVAGKKAGTSNILYWVVTDNFRDFAGVAPNNYIWSVRTLCGLDDSPYQTPKSFAFTSTCTNKNEQLADPFEATTTLSFDAYPNPAQNTVTITCDSFDNAKNLTIAIADLAGRIVAKQKANGYQTEMDVTNLSNGTYFVTLQNGEYKAVSKLVIVK